MPNPHPRIDQLPIPGPGRPKETPEKRNKRLALKEFYKQYLESGEAVKDFHKHRLKQPGSAIEMAEKRIYGMPSQAVQHSGAIKVEVVNVDDD